MHTPDALYHTLIHCIDEHNNTDALNIVDSYLPLIGIDNNDVLVCAITASNADLFDEMISRGAKFDASQKDILMRLTESIEIKNKLSNALSSLDS